ncbi:hypothetical protein Tco_1020817 [Tanacetum coccineum]
MASQQGSVDPTLFQSDEKARNFTVDTPLVEKSKLDEDKPGKLKIISHYRGMLCTLLYLTASRPDPTICYIMWCPEDFSLTNSICICGQLVVKNTLVSTFRSIQLLGVRLVSWSLKAKSAADIQYGS